MQLGCRLSRESTTRASTEDVISMSSLSQMVSASNMRHNGSFPSVGDCRHWRYPACSDPSGGLANSPAVPSSSSLDPSSSSGPCLVSSSGVHYARSHHLSLLPSFTVDDPWSNDSASSLGQCKKRKNYDIDDGQAKQLLAGAEDQVKHKLTVKKSRSDTFIVKRKKLPRPFLPRRFVQRRERTFGDDDTRGKVLRVNGIERIKKTVADQGLSSNELITEDASHIDTVAVSHSTYSPQVLQQKNLKDAYIKMEKKGEDNYGTIICEGSSGQHEKQERSIKESRDEGSAIAPSGNDAFIRKHGHNVGGASPDYTGVRCGAGIGDTTYTNDYADVHMDGRTDNTSNIPDGKTKTRCNAPLDSVSPPLYVVLYDECVETADQDSCLSRESSNCEPNGNNSSYGDECKKTADSTGNSDVNDKAKNSEGSNNRGNSDRRNIEVMDEDVGNNLIQDIDNLDTNGGIDFDRRNVKEMLSAVHSEAELIEEAHLITRSISFPPYGLDVASGGESSFFRTAQRKADNEIPRKADVCATETKAPYMHIDNPIRMREEDGAEQGIISKEGTKPQAVQLSSTVADVTALLSSSLSCVDEQPVNKNTGQFVGEPISNTSASYTARANGDSTLQSSSSSSSSAGISRKEYQSVGQPWSRRDRTLSAGSSCAAEPLDSLDASKSSPTECSMSLNDASSRHALPGFRPCAKNSSGYFEMPPAPFLLPIASSPTSMAASPSSLLPSPSLSFSSPSSSSAVSLSFSSSLPSLSNSSCLFTSSSWFPPNASPSSCSLSLSSSCLMSLSSSHQLASSSSCSLTSSSSYLSIPSSSYLSTSSSLYSLTSSSFLLASSSSCSLPSSVSCSPSAVSSSSFSSSSSGSSISSSSNNRRPLSLRSRQADHSSDIAGKHSYYWWQLCYAGNQSSPSSIPPLSCRQEASCRPSVDVSSCPPFPKEPSMPNKDVFDVTEKLKLALSIPLDKFSELTAPLHACRPHDIFGLEGKARMAVRINRILNEKREVPQFDWSNISVLPRQPFSAYYALQKASAKSELLFPHDFSYSGDDDDVDMYERIMSSGGASALHRDDNEESSKQAVLSSSPCSLPSAVSGMQRKNYEDLMNFLGSLQKGEWQMGSVSQKCKALAKHHMQVLSGTLKQNSKKRRVISSGSGAKKPTADGGATVASSASAAARLASLDNSTADHKKDPRRADDRDCSALSSTCESSATSSNGVKLVGSSVSAAALQENKAGLVRSSSSSSSSRVDADGDNKDKGKEERRRHVRNRRRLGYEIHFPRFVCGSIDRRLCLQSRLIALKRDDNKEKRVIKMEMVESSAAQKIWPKSFTLPERLTEGTEVQVAWTQCDDAFVSWWNGVITKIEQKISIVFEIKKGVKKVETCRIQDFVGPNIPSIEPVRGNWRFRPLPADCGALYPGAVVCVCVEENECEFHDAVVRRVWCEGEIAEEKNGEIMLRSGSASSLEEARKCYIKDSIIERPREGKIPNNRVVKVRLFYVTDDTQDDCILAEQVVRYKLPYDLHGQLSRKTVLDQLDEWIWVIPKALSIVDSPPADASSASGPRNTSNSLKLGECSDALPITVAVVEASSGQNSILPAIPSGSEKGGDCKNSTQVEQTNNGGNENEVTVTANDLNKGCSDSPNNDNENSADKKTQLCPAQWIDSIPYVLCFLRYDPDCLVMEHLSKAKVYLQPEVDWQAINKGEYKLRNRFSSSALRVFKDAAENSGSTAAREASSHVTHNENGESQCSTSKDEVGADAQEADERASATREQCRADSTIANDCTNPYNGCRATSEDASQYQKQETTILGSDAGDVNLHNKNNSIHSAAPPLPKHRAKRKSLHAKKANDDAAEERDTRIVETSSAYKVDKPGSFSPQLRMTTTCMIRKVKKDDADHATLDEGCNRPSPSLPNASPSPQSSFTVKSETLFSNVPNGYHGCMSDKRQDNSHRPRKQVKRASGEPMVGQSETAVSQDVQTDGNETDGLPTQTPEEAARALEMESHVKDYRSPRHSKFSVALHPSLSSKDRRFPFTAVHTGAKKEDVSFNDATVSSGDASSRTNSRRGRTRGQSVRLPMTSLRRRKSSGNNVAQLSHRSNSRGLVAPASDSLRCIERCRVGSAASKRRGSGTASSVAIQEEKRLGSLGKGGDVQLARFRNKRKRVFFDSGSKQACDEPCNLGASIVLPEGRKCGIADSAEGCPRKKVVRRRAGAGLLVPEAKNKYLASQRVVRCVERVHEGESVDIEGADEVESKRLRTSERMRAAVFSRWRAFKRPSGSVASVQNSAEETGEMTKEKDCDTKQKNNEEADRLEKGEKLYAYSEYEADIDCEFFGFVGSHECSHGSPGKEAQPLPVFVQSYIPLREIDYDEEVEADGRMS